MDALASISWPGTDVITTVLRDFEPVVGSFRGAEFAPINASDFNNSPDVIKWEALGPITGMTNAHMLDANPRPIKFVPLKQYAERTTYWKESAIITETDLLHIRQAGDYSQRMADQIVMKRLRQLDMRTETRVEWLRWQALTGTLTINEFGVTRTIDYLIPGGNKINANSGTGGAYWDVVADANPIKDLQTALLRFRGTNAAQPVLWINMQQALWLVQNAGMRDLVKQSSNLDRLDVNSVGKLIMPLVGGLAGIEIYDQGYISDAGVWTTFIPDTHAFLVAKSGLPGEKVMEFASTPSLHNGGIAGATGGKFSILEDFIGTKNPRVELTGGIYGVPVIYHPDHIVTLRVKTP